MAMRNTIAGEKEKKDERMKGKEQEQEQKCENCKDASSRSSGRHWSLQHLHWTITLSST